MKDAARFCLAIGVGTAVCSAMNGDVVIAALASAYAAFCLSLLIKAAAE